jgi:hypothetical protein
MNAVTSRHTQAVIPIILPIMIPIIFPFILIIIFLFYSLLYSYFIPYFTPYHIPYYTPDYTSILVPIIRLIILPIIFYILFLFYLYTPYYTTYYTPYYTLILFPSILPIIFTIILLIILSIVLLFYYWAAAAMACDTGRHDNEEDRLCHCQWSGPGEVYAFRSRRWCVRRSRLSIQWLPIRCDNVRQQTEDLWHLVKERAALEGTSVQGASRSFSELLYSVFYRDACQLSGELLNAAIERKTIGNLVADSGRLQQFPQTLRLRRAGFKNASWLTWTDALAACAANVVVRYLYIY